MTVGDVLEKIKFIVNDEYLYSLTLGNNQMSLTIVQDVVNTILKTLGLNKKRGYLRVFPFSKNYYFFNKFTSTYAYSNLPYACQLPTSLLTITNVYLYGKNALYEIRFRNEPLDDISSTSPYFWSGGASYLSVSPIPQAPSSTSSDLAASSANERYDIAIGESDLNKIAIPQPVIFFLVGLGGNVYFDRLVVYYTLDRPSRTLKDGVTVYSNRITPSPDDYTLSVFLPNLAFDYIDTQLFSSANDVIDMPEDFKDAIVYKTCEYIYDRMRMENESMYYRRKAEEELKRLMNYVYGDKERPAIREGKTVSATPVRFVHEV
jgi:hypothetical protein